MGAASFHGWREEAKGPDGALPPGPGGNAEASLLADLLLGRGLSVELGRLVVRGDDAERLLQELGGLQAVGAGVAFRLYRRLALRRDSHFNDARHQGLSNLAISFSTRATARGSRSIAWNERLKRVIHWASAARSFSSRARRRWRRRVRLGSGAGAAA